MAPQCARRNVCHDVGAPARVGAMCLEKPGNCSSNATTDILQCTLDPRVAPRRILHGAMRATVGGPSRRSQRESIHGRDFWLSASVEQWNTTPAANESR